MFDTRDSFPVTVLINPKIQISISNSSDKSMLMRNDWTGLKLIKKVLHPKIAQPSLNLSLGVPYFENWLQCHKNLGLVWLSLVKFALVWLVHRQTNKLNYYFILINLICEFVC